MSAPIASTGFSFIFFFSFQLIVTKHPSHQRIFQFLIFFQTFLTLCEVIFFHLYSAYDKTSWLLEAAHRQRVPAVFFSAEKLSNTKYLSPVLSRTKSPYIQTSEPPFLTQSGCFQNIIKLFYFHLEMPACRCCIFYVFHILFFLLLSPLVSQFHFQEQAITNETRHTVSRGAMLPLILN